MNNENKNNFSELIKRFIEFLLFEKGYSKNTIKNYQHDISEFIEYISIIKKIDLTGLTLKILRDYIVFLLNKNISKRSVVRKLSAIKSFATYSKNNSIDIDEKIFELITYPKFERELPEFLTLNDIKKLIIFIDESKNPKDIRDGTIIITLYQTGIRINELINLKSYNINFQTGYIKVLGKGNKERITFVNNIGLKYLNKYNNIRNTFLLKCCNKDKVKNVFFLSNKGNILTPKVIWQKIKHIGILAGLDKKLYPHLFRHTFATHLLNEGANIRDVQEMLGHESINTTQIYTHTSKKRLKDIYLKYHPHAEL